MPVFQIGDLVKPNPGHWTQYNEENPGAIGVIIEMGLAVSVRVSDRLASALAKIVAS